MQTLLGMQLSMARHVNRASVLFPQVQRLQRNADGTSTEIDPRTALRNAIARSGVPAWTEASAHTSPTPTAIRWGPHTPDAPTASLFVDIDDDTTFTTIRAVNNTRLLFDNGPRACLMARVAPLRPQCLNCQKFGHVAMRCRAPPACGTCAGAHHSHDH
ncbi:uncharacterized protein BXZ73DRAFT_22076, partial [Epithele typhae]|uniref:uncharacterized protein n=1 Tax=Epithele typhae TaxID=378194 RepID=UPI0020089304